MFNLVMYEPFFIILVVNVIFEPPLVYLIKEQANHWGYWFKNKFKLQYYLYNDHSDCILFTECCKDSVKWFCIVCFNMIWNTSVISLSKHWKNWKTGRRTTTSLWLIHRWNDNSLGRGSSLAKLNCLFTPLLFNCCQRMNVSYFVAYSSIS